MPDEALAREGPAAAEAHGVEGRKGDMMRALLSLAVLMVLRAAAAAAGEEVAVRLQVVSPGPALAGTAQVTFDTVRIERLAEARPE